jgi:hypothetical protein
MALPSRPELHFRMPQEKEMLALDSISIKLLTLFHAITRQIADSSTIALIVVDM